MGVPAPTCASVRFCASLSTMSGSKVGHPPERGAVASRDHASGRARAVPERRLPRRVLAGAAHHDHADVVGLSHDGEHRVGGVDGGPALDLLPLVVAPEAREWKARVLEEELLDLALAVAVASDGGGVLGTEREQRPAAAEQVVAAGLTH